MTTAPLPTTPEPLTAPGLYGLLAEFTTAPALVAAARHTREAGYQHFDAFSPYPIHDLPEAMGLGRTAVPLITLVAALVGGAAGYWLQFYTLTYDYPWMVGGKPFHSWPMFIPITFELTILCGALGAALSMLALCKLPQPYHPVRNVPAFVRASTDRFFLLIEADDPHFAADGTAAFLREQQPKEVFVVAP